MILSTLSVLTPTVLSTDGCSNGVALSNLVGEPQNTITANDELKALYKVKIDLINKIESTLLKLGTYKRVQSEFPEAYKYLEMARASVPTDSPSVMEIKNILALAKNS